MWDQAHGLTGSKEKYSNHKFMGGGGMWKWIARGAVWWGRRDMGKAESQVTLLPASGL